jgi:hypothetical protein
VNERQRVAKLTMTVEYADGQSVRIDGENLLADAVFDLGADYGDVALDAQDAPVSILPVRSRRLKVDITLDLHGKLTVSDGSAAP